MGGVDGADELQAVHLGHLDVEKDQLDVSRLRRQKINCRYRIIKRTDKVQLRGLPYVFGYYFR